MRKYESVIILNPNLTEEAVKVVKDKITAIINNDGKVEKVDELGRRKLAYEVKKCNEGIYLVFYFEANSKLIEELQRNYRIMDEVIKFIVINVEE